MNEAQTHYSASCYNGEKLTPKSMEKSKTNEAQTHYSASCYNGVPAIQKMDMDYQYMTEKESKTNEAQTHYSASCYNGVPAIQKMDMDYQYMTEKERKREKLTPKYTEKRQDPKDCAGCTTFQQELAQKNTTIKELECTNHKTRSELEELKKKHQVFRDRMSIEASFEIGTSGEIFEDISNPCRESELRSSYNKMKTTMWPKIIKEIEKKTKESIEDKNEEKKRAKKMIKEVFAKAANDMMEKKTALESFFKISDKTTVNKKQLQCFDMAAQSLQLMIFWEECTRYQDMYKQLGHSSPDYFCELADQCYKQGCLMELHNPALTPDWDSDDMCPFPPITTKSMDKI
ncbi:hypothetical protein R3I94_013101 [Phoxinus phoxinus]